VLTRTATAVMLGLLAACRATGDAPTDQIDGVAIEEALGVEPSRTADGVLRVTWPRTDVDVSVDGVKLTPPAGLTSWAGFSGTDDAAMVMGDTVVFQDEVGPAMDAAFDRGLAVTALHNHFFFDEPKVYFMHIGGRGDARSLARGVRAIWDAVREVRRANPRPAPGFAEAGPAPTGSIDAAALEAILGHPAAVAPGGVVKFTVGREAGMGGMRFGASMGLTTWAAFTGSDELSVVAGDFAMTGGEVQPVLQALRAAGIHVVALHNHMVGEEPAYYFTHFWGRGRARTLARGLRGALDARARAVERK